MLELAGGWKPLFEVAKNALSNNEFQWTLQLTDFLLKVTPTNKEVISLRIKALDGLGNQQSNPNARYYYLSSAEELLPSWQDIELLPQSVESIQGYPVNAFLDILKV